MEIEAIYDHGRLELPEDIRLKHQRFRVRLVIPNEGLASGERSGAQAAAPPSHAQAQGTFLEQMQAILAPIREQLVAGGNQQLSKEERRELCYQEWEEHHRGEC